MWEMRVIRQEEDDIVAIPIHSEECDFQYCAYRPIRVVRTRRLRGTIISPPRVGTES
jgi:hypothetical protein